MANPEPGWYPDPAGSGAVRYWDGGRWLEPEPSRPSRRAPHSGRSSGLLQAAGLLMMIGAAVLAVVAYMSCHGTQDPLEQRDAIVLALGAVVAVVIGAALFTTRRL